MDKINFAENLVRLRRERKLTQDAVADFLGVTKASVSKWENGQSFPDIVLFPRLAAFFDTTVDHLLGYEAWLSKEQIQKYYAELAAEFAERPFEEVMEKSRRLVKEYYSCYPFLLQICVLWLNHYMLAEGAGQKRILDEMAALCRRIEENCREIGICNDAVMIRSIVNLQRGNPLEVIETLEDILNPYHSSTQSTGILIQAYQMIGQTEKAEEYNQMSMYFHLLELLSCGIRFMEFRAGDEKKVKETMRKLDGLLDIFNIEGLQENAAAGYHFHAALLYCMYGQYEMAMERLKKFAGLSGQLIETKVVLHGDAFFDCLDTCIGKLDLGAQGVRSQKLIADNIIQAFAHPAFAPLFDNPEFIRLKKRFQSKIDRR